jgi:F-type H+-transporting ATPase subunit delta
VKQTILARRYAKAIFAVGQEQGKYEEYNDVLTGVSGLFDSNPEVVDALTNPLYPLDVREKVMVGMIGSMGVDSVMSNFLNLLVEKKRAEILPEIAEEYKIMVD